MKFKNWLGRNVQKDSETRNNESSAPLSGPDGAFSGSPSPNENDGNDGDPQTGENKTMSGLVDTLENTRAYDDRAEYSPESIISSSRTTDGQGMSFTFASGSKPLQGYTIKRGVGVGGFGEVYFAISDAGKEVALKRVQRNLDVEVRGVSHCLNLKHPNLIALYDIRYDDSGQAWVVMEYVAGQSLRSALDRAPNGLTESEVRRWFAALGAGVTHLHDAGIVHRDLKPGNIFDDDGIVKIGDYGLSKYISCSRHGAHTESVGTFHYMAPEVGRGNYGREIDVYAMGIILYEMLTGNVPFDGESSHEIVMKHLTANPDLSGVAEPYRSVIWQALQKNPEARQQSVLQMLRPLGIELDSHGLARPATGSLQDPVIGRMVSHSPEPGIEFDPAPESSTPSRATPRNPFQGSPNRNAPNDVRFGEVQYHRPSPVPLAGSIPQPQPAAARPARNEEPMARAVRSTMGDIRAWWSSLEPYPGTRIVLVVLGVALLVMNTSWLLPLLTLLAIVYVPYYILRAMILGTSRQPSYSQARYVAAQRPQPRVLTAKQWRERRRTELAAKPASLRIAELSSSTTRAVISAAALSLAGLFLTNVDSTIRTTEVASFGWCGLVAVAAAVMVLMLSKLWESEERSSLGRRFVMLGAGAAVGAAAYALANFLMVPLDDGLSREIRETPLPPSLYAAGVPMVAALMAHFAILLGGLRWWRVADPLRRSRISLFAIAVAIVGEWGLHQILPIPQPLGMITAGFASVAVQIAAPWENPKQRFNEPVTPSTAVA